jgi:hypothetical protein
VINVDDCRLDGFTVEKGTDPLLSGGILVDGNYHHSYNCITIYGTVLKNLIVRNNHGIFGGGIRLQCRENTLLQNIEVYNNEAYEGAGIWMAISNNTTSSNNITLVNVLVYNNTASGTGTVIGFAINRGSGLFIESVRNVKMINTTVANNGESDDNANGVPGGDVYSVASTIELDNSIVKGDFHISALYPSPPLSPTISLDFLYSNNSMIGSMSFKNVVYGPSVIPPPPVAYPTVVFNSSRVGPMYSIGGSISPLITLGTTTIVSSIPPDPLFVGFGGVSLDYCLQSGSPCIDAGERSYVNSYTTIDLAGNNRIAGINVDMGVYEFGSSAAPPTIVNAKSMDGKREERLLGAGKGVNLYVYPNPANYGEMTTIYLGEGKEVYENPVMLKVYGIDGRLLYSQTFPYGEIQTDFSNLASGMYVINVQTQEGVTYKQKLLINK